MLKHHSGVGFFQVCVAAMLVAGLALCLPASAQTFRGSIIGTVSDSSGAAIAQATITAKNTATGLTRTSQTSSDGSYSLPELTIGNYEVSASKSGFQTAVATGISVEVARDRHVDFTLKPGSVAQRVEVTEQAVGVPIETSNDNLGGSFENKDIVDLPINGRDIDKLYIMVPGVTGDPSGAAGSPASYGQFSANGNRDRANNFLLDGTDMNDSYRNLPAINQGGVFAVPANTLPIESIAELRVLTNFDAEYGRNSGSVVDVVTKSGTNEIHGSVFEYFRNAVLNARNFFDTTGPKDAFRNNQFGGAIGGPIKKNKIFFYGAYEGQREGLGLTSLNTVPTLNNGVAGSPNDYTQAIAALGGTTPCTTTVIACINAPGNVGVINPVIVNLYNLCNTKGGCSGGTSPWPSANIPTTATGFNNVSSDASSNNVDSGIAKVDYSLNSANTLSARYYYGESTQSFPLGTAGGNNIPNTNTIAPTNTNLVSVSLVSVVSAHQVNEGRFGFNRFREGFFPEGADIFGNPDTSFGLNTCLGLVTNNSVATCTAGALATANPVDYGLPQIEVGGVSSLGSSRYSNPRNRIDRNYQFVDNFSWKLGKNDVKFGGEIRHTSVDSLEDLNFRGLLDFSDLEGFLDGDVTGGRINYGTTERYTHQDSIGLFIQDTYQILPHLTLNAGIRWDYYGVIREGSDGISSYNPAVGLVPMNQPYKPDWNNFGPRVSLAWDPFGKGKTVIRAGAAVFYDSFSFDFFDGQIFEPTNNLGPAYNAIPGHPVYQGFAVGGPLVAGTPVFDTAVVTGCPPAVAYVPSISCDTTDASTVGHLVTPYVATFTLNVQQELTKNTVLQVGYVGTQGRKLQRLIDANQPSNAAITAYDVTCIDESQQIANGLGMPLTMCGNAGNPGGIVTPFTNPITVPRNFNNEQNFFFPTLPGQNNNAAVMSALAPQTPFYLEQLQTSAQSAYNSLQVSLTQRNWHGITQQVSYTWSHSIDDASDGQDFVPHTAQPNDSTNPSASNIGNSNFDTRNHFVWSATYAFPKAHALGRFGEGWSMSSVVTIVSGHPWEVIDAGDDYDGSGEYFGRTDLVGPLHYNYSNPAQFLDISAFAVPCTLDGALVTTPTVIPAAANCLAGSRHFGTEGRNALIGPAFRQWDFSIVKNTRITERYSIQFRADAFNLLNHPNFANPLEPSDFPDISGNAVCGSTVTAGCPAGSTGRFMAGQYFPISATADTGIGNPILGGGGPRSFQFAMKLIF